MSKILIIEDEEAIADLEKDYLELSGFEVEIEHRGDVGLKMALEGEYDLFILRWTVLKSAGRSAIRKIRLLSWFLPRRTILTRSEVWDLAQMII